MTENIAKAITGFLQYNNNPLGLLVLGLSAIVEYLFPPFPGDTVTLFGSFLVVRHNWSLPLVFLVVLVGSGIGAMIDFYVGVWMGKHYRSGRFFSSVKARAQIERVLLSFRRHGEKYVAINRFFPAVRAIVFLAAGMADLRPFRVFFYALVSAAAWNALIIYAGYALDANWEKIKTLFQNYSYFAWGVLGILALVFVVRWIYKRN